MITLEAFKVEVTVEEVEATLINEFLGEFIGLEEVHECEGVGLHGDVGLLFLFEEPVHEFLSLNLAVLVLVGPLLRRIIILNNVLDQHGQDVRS